MKNLVKKGISTPLPKTDWLSCRPWHDAGVGMTPGQ